MTLARAVFLRAAESAWLARQASERRFVQRSVRRFVPGEDLEAALAAVAELHRGGVGSVLTQLGENIASAADADAVRAHYLTVLGEVKRRELPAWISVKPTQLGIDQSAAACAGHVDALAAAARDAGSSLWIDMEDSRYADRTLELYQRVRARYDRVGVALQAYLRRTPDDLARLLPLKPWIRLVKGAYAEPPTVAFPVKRDTDLAYYDLALRLLDAAGRGEVLAVFGTHDMPLLDRVLAAARERGVGPDRFEVHMLYGIRSADQQRLARAGHRVRTLISYGRAWFKWYMRRLAERPANVWFVLRNLVAG
jgi:proline dehydrogenase